MKSVLLSLILLAGMAQAWEYQRNAAPLPLPENYQVPAGGKTVSRFNRQPLPPCLDAETGALVVECCEPPLTSGGVSHFYTVVYRLSADGRTLTRTERMWQSHMPGVEAHCRTHTLTTDTPFAFNSGSSRVVFEVDAHGRISKVTQHGKLFHKTLPPEGKIFYPSAKAPGIIHVIP